MRLARAQANQGAEVTIVTVSSGNEQQCFDNWVAQLGLSANVKLLLWPGGWLRTFLVGGEVRELRRTNDVVHVHGIWDPLVTRCLSARVRGGARVVLAPHGMLSSWSLQQKKLKKRLAWYLWMRSSLMRVARFHALNGAEMQELRALLPNAQIGVLANGTDFVPPPDRAAARWSESKYILFLARLHFMKGPDRLIDAFAHCVRTRALPPSLDGRDLLA